MKNTIARMTMMKITKWFILINRTTPTTRRFGNYSGGVNSNMTAMTDFSFNPIHLVK